MKRLLVALFLVALSFSRPAHGQPQDPAVAQVQALLADAGQWSLEHQAVIQMAAQPLVEMDSYVDVFDRFESGEINERRATEEIEAWRVRAIETIARSRTAATALREPPSLAQLNASGEALQDAMNAARDGLLPTIQELERLVNACADIGIAALREPGKALEARYRALLQAQVQLLRVDANRLRLTSAALASDQPARSFLIAMQQYYAASIAVPEYALDELDGGGDRVALVQSLRQSSQDMRATLAHAEGLIARMQAQSAANPASELSRALQQVVESLPASVRAFAGLADNIDRIAAEVEGGAEVFEVWIESEAWDRPYLLELERLDQARAQFLANVSGSAL